jgi:flagellar hook-basal body complex protein FliE
MMDYTSIISHTLPGTFVPNLAPSGTSQESQNGDMVGQSQDAPNSFKDTLQGFLHQVNESISASDTATQDLAMGKTTDIGAVAASVEEANLALSFTTAMQSKIVSAYQQISAMQV